MKALTRAPDRLDPRGQEWSLGRSLATVVLAVLLATDAYGAGLNRQARTQCESGQTAAAIDALETSFRDMPPSWTRDDAERVSDLAWCRFYQGERAVAEDELHAFLASRPQDSNAEPAITVLVNLGRIRVAADDAMGAVSPLHAAILLRAEAGDQPFDLSTAELTIADLMYDALVESRQRRAARRVLRLATTTRQYSNLEFIRIPSDQTVADPRPAPAR